MNAYRWQMEAPGKPLFRVKFDPGLPGVNEVVGFTMEKLRVRLSNLMAFHARALGNWGCLPEYSPAAVELVLTGKVAMLPFIEQHPLSEINEIFAGAHEGKLIRRAILVPDV